MEELKMSEKQIENYVVEKDPKYNVPTEELIKKWI